MTVPVRYILAALALSVAGLGLTPAASAQCGSCQHNPPPPPPPTHCNCQPATVVAPLPHVPPPNIVVVNSGARASAQASAIAIAVANVHTGDTIIRQNTVVDAGAYAGAAAQSSALTVTEASVTASAQTREADVVVQAVCIDATNNPHPASQTFGARNVDRDYAGEVYRCMSGTRSMRVTVDGRSFDCAAGQALWHENGQVTCRTQIERRPCNERSLLRRFGAGDKIVHIRETAMRETRTETSFNGAMSMDGGVGAGG
ncbi:MAG TPA: hypothetical protein VHC73_00795 [Vitreimonas sp.]|nr:hypothetical protein [Vitreimonas sp.]